MNRKRITFFALLLTVSLLAGCGVVQREPTAQGPDASADSASTTTGDTQSRPLEGADIVLKLSHTDNDISMLSNTWNCYARTFKSNLETLSSGTMSVEIFPNSQLGDETSVIEQCSQGTVDMVVAASAGNYAVWVPNFNVFDIPYLMSNLDVCSMVCQSEIVQELSDELSEKANMELLSVMVNGFRNLDTWKSPVTDVSQMKGMKVRIQNIEAQTNMIKAWGAVPTSVAFSELYSAASTGVIDAFEQANYGLFINNLYEAVDYVTETNHLANTCTAVISTKTMSKLTEAQQSWVRAAAAEARRAALGVVTANNVNVVEQLREAGIEIIPLTEEQKAGFKDACFEICKESVLKNVDADFYQRFIQTYEEAEAYLGLR